MNAYKNSYIFYLSPVGFVSSAGAGAELSPVASSVGIVGNTLAGEFDQNDIQDAVIEIRPVENSAVIVIKTRSNSPALAYSISRNLPNQVTADIVPNSLVNLYPIQVLDPAAVPQTPVSPNVSLSYLLGGVGSLVLGVGFAFVWYSIKQSRNAVVDYEM